MNHAVLLSRQLGPRAAHVKESVTGLSTSDWSGTIFVAHPYRLSVLTAIGRRGSQIISVYLASSCGFGYDHPAGTPGEPLPPVKRHAWAMPTRLRVGKCMRSFKMLAFVDPSSDMREMNSSLSLRNAPLSSTARLQSRKPRPVRLLLLLGGGIWTWTNATSVEMFMSDMNRERSRSIP